MSRREKLAWLDMTPRFALSLCAALLATGCATPRLVVPNANRADVRADLRVRWSAFFDKEARVEDAAWKIRHASSPLCPKRALRSGFSYVDDKMYEAAWRERVWRYPAVEGWSVIQHVAAGSPAEAAGLKPGDVVTWPERKYRRYRGGWDPEPDTLEVTYRDGRVIGIPQVRVCETGVGVLKDQSVNAFTNGEVIAVTEGAVDFVTSDDELAFLLAHELGHVVEDHIGKRQSNALWRGLAGAFVDGLTGCLYCNTGGRMAQAGAGAYAVEFEREADYVAAYMMELSGYDPLAAKAFFDRMMADNTTPSVLGTTHPVSAERIFNVELAVEEIASKKMSGAPIRPTVRGK